ELVHTRRDGQKIIVESRMVVVGDPAGRKVVVEATRPITERKESERILRRLADDLVTADRNKDEFLAMLAHELRNPLAPLRNVVSVLQSDIAGQEDKGKALEIMDRQISSMARLLDDLLDVSRITLSQIELRKERVELVGAMRRVVDQNASYFQLRQQSLNLSLPREPLYVHADPVRLEQIVGNLLNNASKYTQRGGKIFLIVDEASEGGDNNAGAGRLAVVRVRDNGPGIAPDKLPFVFDMFMRATRSIDQEHGGLGVGLTLVRRLTQLHGGTVQAYSEGLGRGSEFVVRLPLIEGAAATHEYGIADRPETFVKTQRILVVDDNRDNRESMAMTLRMAHHDVAIAETGHSALQLAASFKPEVVLMDIGMPDMNGYELARQLRQEAHTKHAALIAFSGFGDEDAKRRAREAGIDEYIVKPASIAEITSAILALAARE
ncbi:MAG TPA: ATP-binding protein, partial [Burkholderiales bacterium]|nr:ATP-binding protein [Burkholderiales bacterium]